MQMIDMNLLVLLDRYCKARLILNPNKVKFKCNSVPFFGIVVTDNSIKPYPCKGEKLAST